MEDGEFDSVAEMNNRLSCPDQAEGIGGSCLTEIVAYNWRIGQVHFNVRWNSGETAWEHLKDMREGYPSITAQYIVGDKVSRSKHGGDRVLQ